VRVNYSTIHLNLSISRFVPYVLHTSVFSYESVTMIVRTSTRTLFPDGWPAPGPPDPTPEEQMAIREALINRLVEIIPGIYSN
jgi:hypothetical protein